MRDMQKIELSAPAPGRRRGAALLAGSALVFLAGCLSYTGPSEDLGTQRFGGSVGGGTGHVVVVNGVPGVLDVYVDGNLQTGTVAGRSVSTAISVPAGTRSIELRPTNQKIGGSTVVVAIVDQTQTILAAVTVGSTLQTELIPDSSSTSVPGVSRVRVLNLASNVPALSVWNTRPDAPAPALLVSPLLSNSISRFVQGSPGSWEFRVWDATSPVTTWDGAVTRLVFDVASGEVRTVVIFDNGGGLRLLAVPAN